MSKMLIILVIYFVYSIVSAEEYSDETKYIDLLPKKEKDDFLERIARRIFDKVQSKDDRDRDSGEVFETQLDEHDEFVKKILEEESMNLRKSDNVNTDNENYNFDSKTNVKEANDESLVKDDDHDAVDAADVVDLVLRDGKRNKRNSIKHTNENSKIIRVTGDGGTYNQNNGNKHAKAQSMQDTDGSDVEDIQIKYIKNNIAADKNEMEVTTQSASDLHGIQIIDFDSKLVKDHSKETVVASTEHAHESSDDSHKSQENKRDVGNKNKVDNNDDNFGSYKAYESLGINDTKKDSSIKDGVTKDILRTTSEPLSPDATPTKSTTEQLQNLNDTTTEVRQNISANARFLRFNTVNVTVGDNEETVTKSVTSDDSGNDDVKKSKSVLVDAAEEHDLEKKSNSHSNTGDMFVDSKDLTTEYDKINTTDETTPVYGNIEQATEIFIDFDSTTLKTEVLTETPLETEVNPDKKDVRYKEIIESNVNTLKPDTKEVKNIVKELNPNSARDDLKQKNIPLQSDKKVKKDAETDKNSLNLVNDMIKVLRTGINPVLDSNKRNFNGLRELYENMKPKEYNVYEIPPGKQPYIQKDHPDMTNKENAYYVPVYNYSPENAYYNPHNRLGPNADDDNENIIITNDKTDDEKDYNNHNLHRHERDDYENDRYDINIDLDTNSDKPIRDNNYKVINAGLKKLLKIYSKNKDQRKFRFGNTKQKPSNHLSYKLNLPVVISYPKLTDILLNSNDYLDMDYYYGRTLNVKPKTGVRSRCELDDGDKKKGKGSIFPDSTEGDHPQNSMHGENLKNHMRAVRQLLYKQKNFGLIKPVNSTESASCETNECKEEKPTEKQLRTRFIDKLKPSKHNMNNNNIAMDYFFGRMNEDAKTIAKEIILNSPKVAHKEENRDPSVTNRGEHLKYLNHIPFNGKIYNTNYIQPATPAYIDEPIQHYPKLKVLRKDKKKENLTDFQTIKQILSVANDNDLLNTLDKLLKLNLTTRTRNEIDLESYVTVLENMVQNGGKGLKQYDWLGTTVDIQSALMKLMDMTDAFKLNAAISQPDLQLLKYTVYVHNSLNVQEKDLRMTVLPRNRRKKKGILKESGLYSRNWLIRKLKNGVFAYDTITKDDLNDFNEFLFDLQYYLYDLHTAIQQIANITKFNSQRWFENLKELYLDTNRKNILEVLLHMTTVRLLDLIENSARNGLQEDFLTYVMKNEKDVERTKEEYWFALKIIEALRLNS